MIDVTGLTKYQLYLEVKKLSQNQLIEVYRHLMTLRKSGQEFKFPDLQERLEIVNEEGKNRDLKLSAIYMKPLPAEQAEHAKPAQPEGFPDDIEVIATPQSSSIGAYGYDSLLNVLYVRYKSGDKVYPYQEVSKKEYQELQAADSKGKYIMGHIRKAKSIYAAKAAALS